MNDRLRNAFAAPHARALLRLSVVLVALLMATGITATPGLACEASHALTVTLHPEEGALSGIDRIRLENCTQERVSLGLHPRVRIEELTVNGRPRTPSRTATGPVVLLEPSERNAPVTLVVRYRGVFQDEAPVLPVNTDNPGYGVSGTIGPRGTLLLGGAGWYPAVDAAEESVRLRVLAPPGISAVTSGRSLGVTTQDHQTLSAWQIDPPAERLALSAGRYVLTRSRAGTVPTATYFLADDPALAATYLTAADDYIALYAGRYGPYAFPKFAVVENFFPTGYGFPSYTLIGGRVLRLPFIVETSLGHEIAHCWWGNGVRVDRSDGNWSEGLTSYVAEHLYQEMASPEAAREHRRQLLRNYATLVPPAKAFPLRRFTHRFDPVTKAIGYDKSAMIFHMLRRTIGEAAFESGLRRLYATRLHQDANWGDLQQAFEHHWGKDLSWFFEQWLDRPGAPTLWLENVRTTPLKAGRYRVEGVLRQSAPFFRLSLPLVVASSQDRTAHVVAITDGAADFAITVAGAPQRLEGDPQNHVLRRLAPEEIPPAVNALRRAAPLLVVVADDTVSPGQREAAETLARGLGRNRLTLILEKELDPETMRGRDLLVLGVPRNPDLRQAVAQTMSLGAEGFTLQGTSYDAARAGLFGVWRHPLSEGRVMAVLAHGSESHRVTVARKIPHYGRYSYLVFEEATNRVKGVWAPAASPLVVSWPEDPEDA